MRVVAARSWAHDGAVPYPSRPRLQPLAQFRGTVTSRPGPELLEPLVAFVLEQYADGRSLREIAEDTDRRSPRCATSWTPGVPRRGAGAPSQQPLSLEAARLTNSRSGRQRRRTPLPKRRAWRHPAPHWGHCSGTPRRPPGTPSAQRCQCGRARPGQRRWRSRGSPGIGVPAGRRSRTARGSGPAAPGRPECALRR